MLEISEKEILNRLEFDNPWWMGVEPNVGRFSNLPHRFYFTEFLHLITQTKVNRAVVLMGPRRVGKTVMIHHAIQDLFEQKTPSKQILYLSLDTPIYTGIPLEKIVRLFFQRHQFPIGQRLYIFFDEIQYLPKWEQHLKSLVDSFPNIRFIASGSSAAALRLKSRESGAGRFTEYLLPPLTFREYLDFIKRKDLIDFDVKSFTHPNISELNKEFVHYVNYGGYPEAVFSKEIQEKVDQYIKNDIIDKVLLRDLPSLYGISDIQELNRLFTVLAYNTGQEVSLDQLSQRAGVAKNTIKRYLEYLEAAFLIQRIHRTDRNARRFERANFFKVYLTNPSMRGALFGYVNETSPSMGALAETAVYSQWFHLGVLDQLNYARWPNGEVDMVLLDTAKQKPWLAIEIKWSDRVGNDKRELENLLQFSKAHKLKEAIISSLTIQETIEEEGIKIFIRPTSFQTLVLGLGLEVLKAFQSSFKNFQSSPEQGSLFS